MNTALQKLLPTIETWPDEDQEALAEAAREIEALRTGVYTCRLLKMRRWTKDCSKPTADSLPMMREIRALWKRAGL